MRPHAEISHSLNGRVKDISEAYDEELPEMYRRIIEVGVEHFEAELDAETHTEDAEQERPKPKPAVEDEPEPVENEHADVDDLLARVRDEIPGSGPKQEKRVEAMRAVLERLEEVEFAETGDLQSLAWSVDDETYARKRSLWTNSILPGLRRLRDDGVVEGGKEKEGGWWMVRG